jgi:rhodanese-related sulfurtransferase
MNRAERIQEACFALRYSEDALLLDVRSPQEFAQFHLDGAINVETTTPPITAAMRERLNWFIARLLRFSRRRDRPIVVYCAKGVRSTVMEDALISAGFYNVINLGGLQTNPVLRQMARRGQRDLLAATFNLQ